MSEFRSHADIERYKRGHRNALKAARYHRGSPATSAWWLDDAAHWRRALAAEKAKPEDPKVLAIRAATTAYRDRILTWN